MHWTPSMDMKMVMHQPSKKTKNETQRVAIYARVRIGGAGGNKSVSDQLEPMRRHCSERGWTVDREFTDPAKE